MRSRRILWACLAALALGACGDDDAKRVLALGDDSTAFCLELAGRMSASWSQQQNASQRALAFEQTDASYFDASRRSCAAALRLLDELDRTRPPLAPGAERDLQRVLTLERLLLHTVSEPDMDADVFEATRAYVASRHPSLRSQLNASLPMAAGEKQRLAAELGARWKAMSEEASPAR